MSTIKQARTKLPSPMIQSSEVSLWSIIKHCIGKDLSRIAMPVVFNEPLSFLQRLMENAEYLHLLAEADAENDPVARMEVSGHVRGTSTNRLVRLCVRLPWPVCRRTRTA